jgi:hypothetical protein
MRCPAARTQSPAKPMIKAQVASRMTARTRRPHCFWSPHPIAAPAPDRWQGSPFSTVVEKGDDNRSQGPAAPARSSGQGEILVGTGPVTDLQTGTLAHCRRHRPAPYLDRATRQPRLISGRMDKPAGPERPIGPGNCHVLPSWAWMIMEGIPSADRGQAAVDWMRCYVRPRSSGAVGVEVDLLPWLPMMPSSCWLLRWPGPLPRSRAR